MASQGPRFPGTAASLANAGTSENANAWVSPGNVGADDATEASITAATYDSPDIGEILVASNFTFTIPAGSTIDGITVEIDRRSIIASSGKDFRVQLATGTTFADLVGTNKAAPATIWPTTSTVATYGGAADTWTAGLTAAQVNAVGFAVFLSAQANIANADIGVDFIRVTINYTLVPVSVTPGTASLTLTAFAPTVLAPRLVTPGTASLTTARFAPTVSVSDNKLVTPGIASLSLTAFAPTVTTTAGGGATVTPGTAALSLTTFAPTVALSDHKLVSPGTASLTLTAFAPAVVTSLNQLVTPGTAHLTLTGYAPTVTGSAPSGGHFGRVSRGGVFGIPSPAEPEDDEAFLLVT
jgi:hypothetical protein